MIMEKNKNVKTKLQGRDYKMEVFKLPSFIILINQIK
jgi:hypothetical protein